MSRTKFVYGRCGHLSTEEYLNNPENFLQCCAKCWKKADEETSWQKLEEIRAKLSVWCELCRKNIQPLERAGVVLGVFWGNLSEQEALKLTLSAHERHEHSRYDELRTNLELEGWSSGAASVEARRRLKEKGELGEKSN